MEHWDDTISRVAKARCFDEVAVLRWPWIDKGPLNEEERLRRPRAYAVVYIRLTYPLFRRVDWSSGAQSIRLNADREDGGGPRDWLIGQPGPMTNPFEVKRWVDEKIQELVDHEEMMR